MLAFDSFGRVELYRTPQRITGSTVFDRGQQTRIHDFTVFYLGRFSVEATAAELLECRIERDDMPVYEHR